MQAMWGLPVLESREGIVKQRPSTLDKGKNVDFAKFHTGNQKRKKRLWEMSTTNRKKDHALELQECSEEESVNKITKAKCVKSLGYEQMNGQKIKHELLVSESVSSPVIKEIQMKTERKYFPYKISKCFKNRSFPNLVVTQ